MDVSPMDFDALRERAEARKAMGGGAQDEFVSMLRAQNASLAKNG